MLFNCGAQRIWWKEGTPVSPRKWRLIGKVAQGIFGVEDSVPHARYRRELALLSCLHEPTTGTITIRHGLISPTLLSRNLLIHFCLWSFYLHFFVFLIVCLSFFTFIQRTSCFCSSNTHMSKTQFPCPHNVGLEWNLDPFTHHGIRKVMIIQWLPFYAK